MLGQYCCDSGKEELMDFCEYGNKHTGSNNERDLCTSLEHIGFSGTTLLYTVTSLVILSNVTFWYDHVTSLTGCMIRLCNVGRIILAKLSDILLVE